MPSDSPVAGRCGAKLTSGRGFCIRKPLMGAKRCRQHGGDKAITTGMTSERIRWFAEHGRERLGEMMDDDTLLDPARSVALLEMLVQEFTTIPTPDELTVYAKRLANKGNKSEKEVEPDAGHYAEARGKMSREARLLADSLGRRQDAALKHKRMQQAAIYYLTPVLEKTGREVIQIIMTFVPQHLQDDALKALRHRLRASYGEGVATLEEVESKIKMVKN